MHLSSFGVIAIDGSVTKPEPGLDFSGYQAAMAHYQATLKLRKRLCSQVADQSVQDVPRKRVAG
jgi:hypothetical protein